STPCRSASSITRTLPSRSTTGGCPKAVPRVLTTRPPLPRASKAAATSAAESASPSTSRTPSARSGSTSLSGRAIATTSAPRARKRRASSRPTPRVAPKISTRSFRTGHLLAIPGDAAALRLAGQVRMGHGAVDVALARPRIGGGDARALRHHQAELHEAEVAAQTGFEIAGGGPLPPSGKAQLHRALQRAHGVLPAVLAQARAGEVEVALCVLRPQGEEALEALGGGLAPAQAEEGEAAVVEGLEVVRIGRERLVESAQGTAQIALPPELDPERGAILRPIPLAAGEREAEQEQGRKGARHQKIS